MLLGQGDAAQVLDGDGGLAGEGYQAADLRFGEGGALGVVGVDESDPLEADDERDEDGAGGFEETDVEAAGGFIKAWVGGEVFDDERSRGLEQVGNGGVGLEGVSGDEVLIRGVGPTSEDIDPFGSGGGGPGAVEVGDVDVVGGGARDSGATALSLSARPAFSTAGSRVRRPAME